VRRAGLPLEQWWRIHRPAGRGDPHRRTTTFSAGDHSGVPSAQTVPPPRGWRLPWGFPFLHNVAGARPSAYCQPSIDSSPGFGLGVLSPVLGVPAGVLARRAGISIARLFRIFRARESTTF
jgi:hypothetical protein